MDNLLAGGNREKSDFGANTWTIGDTVGYDNGKGSPQQSFSSSAPSGLCRKGHFWAVAPHYGAFVFFIGTLVVKTVYYNAWFHTCARF